MNTKSLPLSVIYLVEIKQRLSSNRFKGKELMFGNVTLSGDDFIVYFELTDSPP